MRLSSAIFTGSSPDEDPYEGLSVDIEKLANESGIDLLKVVSSGDFLGAISLVAECYRAEGLQVGYDPQADNSCHGQVWGNPSSKKRRRLIKNIAWFVEIEGVLLRDE
jgi:hypothetical protein